MPQGKAAHRVRDNEAAWEARTLALLAARANDVRQLAGDITSLALDEAEPSGARRMLAGVGGEVDAYLADLADRRDERGRRLVVRNGHAQPWQVLTSAGAVEVAAPRVNNKRIDPDSGERKRFRSAILAPWCGKSPRTAGMLPLLYLHGLSTGDFVPALEQFLGSAAGLSPAAITRLIEAATCSSSQIRSMRVLVSRSPPETALHRRAARA